ncbi:TadE/TadG family type IV pilus assembly protein [Ahrensia sp. 13_GOM-1096m]|uniref:TadE/TadG family type IV pilus assembly protein n=1 Tax=Ahrensia sp. 13_GOM-1096m TaxID=1380380 RepID=UPI000479F899|nr:TadE/TadG family type IV pilus assembly protein [Ahrensia sp. 13_GOM-1096m]
MPIISRLNKKLFKTASCFHKDTQGQFAIIFAITAVALVLAGGLAVDGARLYSAKSKLDNAMDAAVLATTRDITTGKIAKEDAEEAIGNFLYSNINPASFSNAEVKIDNISIDDVTKTVKVDAHIKLPMTLTAVAGYQTVEVSSASAARYNDDKIEIAMALDVTGSMNSKIKGSPTGETRIEALIEAASAAINTLIPDEEAGKRVRIGLVPYSASVNISPIKSEIQISGKTKGCVIERTNSKRYTDDFSSGWNKVKGISYAPGKWWNDRDGNPCTSNEILPLTNDTAKLTSKIKNLDPYGFTAGHVGIAWAQYMLSSKWNTAWPTESEVAPSSDKTTKKFAVIMTDGEFNTFLSNGQGNGKGANESRSYAENLCTNIKDNDIKVFTINFAGGDDASKLMAKCASPDTETNQFFFDASSGEDLKKAFQAIAESIKGLRLVG